MIIKAKIEGRNGQIRTQYYKHTSAGRPVWGSKGDAASFAPVEGGRVLEQLKVIDRRCTDAELVDA